jgi:predicted DNA-binding mobile mystery protein A
MNTRFLELGRQQLDQKLKHLRLLRNDVVPTGGWLKAIRTGLGLTAVALAKKLGVTSASLSELEHSETAGTITLKSLRKAAAAMDCDVVYAIVPRTSLEDILKQRAREKALSILGRVGQSMKLEDQEVGPRQTHQQVQALTKTLLENPNALWK